MSEPNHQASTTDEAKQSPSSQPTETKPPSKTALSKAISKCTAIRDFVGKWLLTPVLLLAEILCAAWLWDSYRPRITINPGGTLDSKDPFKTVFIVQNQGALPIDNVTYTASWMVGGVISERTAPQNKFQERFITVIRQMKPLESYSLRLDAPPQPVKTNSIDLKPGESITLQSDGKGNWIQMAPVIVSSGRIAWQPVTNLYPNRRPIVLWFNVTYKPTFFGKRTDVLYFFAKEDASGIYQWFPSGHEDVWTQPIDTNLSGRH